MPGSGTRTFLESDHYEASLRQAQIEFVITCGAGFKARQVWAELHHSQLLRCEEDLPRIGFCLVAAAACLHKFSGEFGPVAKVARHGIATWRYHVPQPRRAAAPDYGRRLRLEPDHVRPGAA